MATDVFKDSDSGYLGGRHMHPEEWRVHGNEAQMVDASSHGPLSAAEDDMDVNDRPEKPKWPNAPGFIGGDVGEPRPDQLSGAFDGAESSARNARA